jgi:mannose-6-phosphate isomerase-like protein (cupin superfamily)
MGSVITHDEITMKFITAQEFSGKTAWEAMPIANMSGITTRLHWTDKPYKWHTNDGEEVFVVLDGTVDMHYRDAGGENVRTMVVGDIFYAGIGTEHVAHPVGEARVLVIEREGSD